MKKDGFLGVYLALCTIAADSQVEQFANSNQSLLRLNPSFAGSNQLIRNQFSFRNALPNQSSARVLYSNSLDGYIAPLQAGIGIGVSMEDQAHSNYKRNVASVSYAQHLRVTDNLIIVPSVQVAAWLSRLDLNAFHFGDLLHDDIRWTSPSPIPSFYRRWTDVSFGLLSNYGDRLFAGVAAYHVNRPDYAHLAGYRMPVSWVAHASYNFILKERTTLQPALIYRRQGTWEQVRINANMVVLNRLIVGLGVSSESSGLIAAGVRWNRFNLMYNYEYAVTEEGRPIGSVSHELHFSVNIRDRGRRNLLTSFETM